MITRTLIVDALAYKKFKAFGFQEYLFNLLDYFFENREQLNFEKIIIACNLSEKNDFEKYNRFFEIRGFKFSSLFFRLVIQFFLPVLIKTKSSDVILFPGNYSSPLKKTKNILVIHDLLYLRKEYLPDFLMRLQRKFYVPLSVFLADTIITISEFTKKDLLNYYTTKKNISTVYNYFNFKKYNTDENFKNRLIENKYFLCVSSDAMHKNLITIFKAFEKYCSFDKTTNLCLVGSLSEKNTSLFYQNLSVDIKNRIHIYSNISNKELSNLYKNCEAYLSASLFEGLGMPVIEAMYFNTPLIISDIEIFHEITENKAIFFNPESYEELYKILKSFIKKDIETKAYVLDKFSSETTSQKYITILNNI